MRLFVLACCGLLVAAGCAGPHSSGGLWSQQNLEREAALFRLTDAQRKEQARDVDLATADTAMVAERSRIETELVGCPGARQALAVSSGDRTRDGIRIRVDGDAARMATVAQLALADWRVRRAAATGNGTFCDAAGAALRGEISAESGVRNLLGELPAATVSRDAREVNVDVNNDPAGVALSQYVLGYIDAVRAAAPLPQYLALVYGGVVLPLAVATEDQETAATTVDLQAAAYPEWEPDALYVALRGGTWP